MKWLDRLLGNKPVDEDAERQHELEREEAEALKSLGRRVLTRSDRIERELNRINADLRKSLGSR